MWLLHAYEPLRNIVVGTCVTSVGVEYVHILYIVCFYSLHVYVIRFLLILFLRTRILTCYTYHTVPSAPQSVELDTHSAYALTVMWSPPSAPRGNPNYIIRFIETSLASTLNVSMWNVTSVAAGQLTATLQRLKPFTKYSVRVAAVTTCGQGEYSGPRVARTGEAPPGPPTDVTVVASLPTSIVISWEAPLEARGNITHYNVRNLRVVEYC